MKRQDRRTYEDPSTTLGRWALAAKTFNLAIGVYFVVLEDGHLHLLTLVLDLLGSLYNLGVSHFCIFTPL
jgi:hypothetical protein